VAIGYFLGRICRLLSAVFDFHSSKETLMPERMPVLSILSPLPNWGLLNPAYVPHSDWGEWLWGVDPCANCGTLEYRHFATLRPSLGGCSAELAFSSEWAQF